MNLSFGWRSGIYYSMKTDQELLGAHFSIAGGLEKALLTAAEYHCPVLQIFTKNARTWKESIPDEDTISLFKQERERLKIKTVFSHASYLINIAAQDQEKRERSLTALRSELIRSSSLGIDGLVLHPGAYLTGAASDGVNRAADGIQAVFSKTPTAAATRLLVETTAGQGTCLGHSFEQIGLLLEKIDAPDRTGVCLDTCHIFAAGYDIRTPKTYEAVIREFDTLIGLQHLYAIHLNDSKTDLGSKRDRHAHIGEGTITETGFSLIMNDPRLKHIPKILETPKEKDGVLMDPVNLSRLSAMVN